METAIKLTDMWIDCVDKINSEDYKNKLLEAVPEIKERTYKGVWFIRILKCSGDEADKVENFCKLNNWLYGYGPI